MIWFFVGAAAGAAAAVTWLRENVASEPKPEPFKPKPLAQIGDTVRVRQSTREWRVNAVHNGMAVLERNGDAGIERTSEPLHDLTVIAPMSY
jgi:hypothetical protein